MEKIENVNIERLKWCCDDFGVDLEELPERVDIAQSTFDAVLNGESSFTFKQLKKIADFFNRGVLFFLSQEPVNEKKVHSPQFRSIANQKPELSPKIKFIVERAEKQREAYLALLEDLNEEPAAFDISGLRRRNPYAAATWARQWLGLEEENSFDEYRAAVEACGVLVFRSNGYAGKWQIPKDSSIMGFSLCHDVCPVVMVKKQAFDTRQTFTLFHELAHLILDHDSSIDDESDFYSHSANEVAANRFAGALLVPDQFLEQVNLNKKPNDPAGYEDWLSNLRKKWGVSTEVILRRLMDTGKLPRRDYEGYREWNPKRPPLETSTNGSRAYRYREPMHIFGDGYVRAVFDALSAHQITITRATSYLDNVKVKDLHKLEGYYAGV